MHIPFIIGHIVGGNMNNIFKKIYVLNLDERSDRWTLISNQLTELKFDSIERVSSTKLHFDSTISKIKLAKISCFHSHLKTLRKSYDLDNVLILEDDCRFIRPIDDITINFINKDNWDMLYLGCNRRIYRNDNTLVYLSDITKVNDSIYEVKECGTTHAIVYSKNMIRKIVDFYPTDEIFFTKAFSLGESYFTYDIFLNMFTKDYNIKKHCVYPLICTQTESYSDIAFCDTSYETEILNSWNKL